VKLLRKNGLGGGWLKCIHTALRVHSERIQIYELWIKNCMKKIFQFLFI